MRFVGLCSRRCLLTDCAHTTPQPALPLLLGRPFSMAFLSSPCFAYLNRPVISLCSGLMRTQGVPVGGNRTEEYARTPSGRPLLVDVYEPAEPASQLRPAVLYLPVHGGGDWPPFEHGTRPSAV